MYNMMNFTKDEIKFWSGFLDKYREFKCLWSKTKLNNDKDRYRIERQSAYLELLNYCRIQYPKADVNFVTQKLQNFGSLFNKSYRKVIKCREQGVTFNPNLWYYNKMLFLVEDEDHHREQNHDHSSLPPVIITRIHKPTIATTELFQSENSVQSVSSEKFDAGLTTTEIKIEEENIADNSSNIPIINTTNCNAYMIENVDGEQSDTNFSNGMNVQDDYSTKSENLNLINQNIEETFSEVSRKNQKSIKRKHRKSTKSIDYITKVTLKEVQKLSREDEYDAAGRKLSFDLRGMSKEQQNLTEKIISEVIYNGKCNLLKTSYIFKPSNDNST